MKKNTTIYLFILLITLSVFYSLSILCCPNKIKLKKLEKRVNAFTQERGTNFYNAKGTPDFLYFVSFAGDTTFYIKK